MQESGHAEHLDDSSSSTPNGMFQASVEPMVRSV